MLRGWFNRVKACTYDGSTTLCGHVLVRTSGREVVEMGYRVLRNRLAVAAGVSAAVLTVAAVPGVAAGKGSTGGRTSGVGSSSLTLVNETAPGTAPAYGQTVTFRVSTTATSEPYVGLSCSQNGAQVYSASAGFFARYPWPWQQNMPLSSGSWTSGAASCVATLYYYAGNGKFTNLARLSFPVRA